MHARIELARRCFWAVSYTHLDVYKRQDIGTFAVLPMSTCHDVAEPLGWLLESIRTGERLVFLTDTSRAEDTFPPLDHILIECNHMGAESMADTNAYQAQRIIDNHLSLSLIHI